MTTAFRPRAVFDCNVFVQAIGNADGPAGKSLALLHSNQIDLFISRAVLREIRSVLYYPSVRKKLLNLTDLRVEQFVRQLQFRAAIVHPVRHRFNYPRAHQDEPYLDLAAQVKAHYLVSRDKDLLSLMSGHSDIAKRFRQNCPGIRIVKPEEFLEYASTIT